MSPALALRFARKRKVAKQKRKERIALAQMFLKIAERNLLHAQLWANEDGVALCEARVREEHEPCVI